MIVVTTPTGRIGSALLPHLVTAGARVRVIARDPSKLPATIAGKVDIVQGAADDPRVIDQAFRDAESVFWCVPSAFDVPDVEAYYLDFTRPAAAALASQGVRRIVSVSSLGRGHRAGAISATFAKDELLEATGVSFRGLWCPGFMENMLMQIPALKHAGAFSYPMKPDSKVPLASTRDIGASAAKLLLDASWTGRGGVAVLGPEDISPNEQATIMSEVLGRPIRFRPVSGAAYKESLRSHGASEALAQGLVDMHAAIDAGLYTHEPRTKENTTPTSFRRWCEEVLKPAFVR